MNTSDVKIFFEFINDSSLRESRLNQFREDRDFRELIYKTNLKIITDNSNINYDLLNMSWDLSLQAINENKDKLLAESLLLISIENFKIDDRDSLIRLCIIDFACKKLNSALIEIVKLVRDYSTDRAIHYYEEYLKRSKSERSLKAMGLVEGIMNNKIVIEQIPPPWMRK